MYLDLVCVLCALLCVFSLRPKRWTADNKLAGLQQPSSARNTQTESKRPEPGYQIPNLVLYGLLLAMYVWSLMYIFSFLWHYVVLTYVHLLIHIASSIIHVASKAHNNWLFDTERLRACEALCVRIAIESTKSCFLMRSMWVSPILAILCFLRDSLWIFSVSSVF